MSTIWTPSGEYVPREEPPKQPAGPPGGPPPGAGAGAGGREPTREEIEAALAEARRVLATPVVEHVGGHAMALFELAALHLEREAATGGQEKPDLAEASLAIDAMAALVEGLGDKLQPYRSQLEDALNQLRMAFVQVSG
ncbi:MAG TPA: hypothetical protein VG795_09015 [Acidimicrobiia bacterium]|nr:hypothetical protein [Acidimicrobiia bacterium]